MDLVKNAISNRPFPQIPFMSEGRFDSFLRDRGFRIGITGIDSLVAAGLIERLNTESGDFHPFQVWPISKLFSAVEIQLDSGISHYGLDHASLGDFLGLNWSCRKDHITDFPKSGLCNEFNQRILPLLLWLESYFLPVVRGPRPGIVHVVGFDASKWTRWDAGSQNPDVLGIHLTSAERLSEWRDRVLSEAFNCDPASDLYLLLRSMPFDQRDRFKGRLRLAYDLYEMAELIRLFLEQVSDQPVVKEWDPHGDPNTYWVQRVYGSQPSFGAPGFLRAVVRHYGLDPAFRVRWLVEGPTEEGFILQYAKRLGANIRDFISIRNFGGDGAFKRQLAAIDADLESAKEEHCFVTLTFDDTSGARRRLEGLKERGLVNFRFVLNRPDFELDNFSVEELISVAVSWSIDLQCPIKSSQESLVRDVERRVNEKNEDFRKAFNSVLRPLDETFQLSKGIQWGERLADYLISKRESKDEEGVYSERTLTKIERQIIFALQNSEPIIDYRGSMASLDPTTLEIT